MIVDAKKLLKVSLQEVMGMVKEKHLGDDAASTATSTSTGLDGSRGCGLNI
jgi:hypothetical protein